MDWVMVELTGVADPGGLSCISSPTKSKGECCGTRGISSGLVFPYLVPLRCPVTVIMVGKADLDLDSRSGPIARSFWANEEMGDLILDGVVCVVDCRNVLKVSGAVEHTIPIQRAGQSRNEKELSAKRSKISAILTISNYQKIQAQGRPTNARSTCILLYLSWRFSDTMRLTSPVQAVPGYQIHELDKKDY